MLTRLLANRDDWMRLRMGMRATSEYSSTWIIKRLCSMRGFYLNNNQLNFNFSNFIDRFIIILLDFRIVWQTIFVFFFSSVYLICFAANILPWKTEAALAHLCNKMGSDCITELPIVSGRLATNFTLNSLTTTTIGKLIFNQQYIGYGIDEEKKKEK